MKAGIPGPAYSAPLELNPHHYHGTLLLVRLLQRVASLADSNVNGPSTVIKLAEG